MLRKEVLDRIQKYVHPFRITKGKDFHLKDFDPADTCGLKDKAEAAELLEKGTEWLAEEQDMLYAQDRWSLLLVFQAMDAAGKDGTIKHVMSGVNPQGCQVYTFKQPSSEELDHDFLWRYVKCLPERGRIGIFNRSYYEEVLVVRVHPEILEAAEATREQRRQENLGGAARRHRQFRGVPHAKRHDHPQVLSPRLAEGAEETLPGAPRQAGEELEVLPADVRERDHWDDYMQAYEEAIQAHRSAACAVVRGPGRSQVVHQARRRRGYCGSGREARTQLPADRCYEEERTRDGT